MTLPYERIVQWTAGPVAIVAGWLATQITTHVSLFGSLGLGKSPVAHAIVAVATFGIGAILTYAAHHKWMDNLTKWWDRKDVQAVASAASALDPKLLTKNAAGEMMPDPDAVTAEIASVDDALAKLLAAPGTPADQIKSGLAPEPTAPVPA